MFYWTVQLGLPCKCILTFLTNSKNLAKNQQIFGSYDVFLSMFVLSKWQCVALPTHWRASVHALFNCYHTFLDHTTNISRKAHAPRRVSMSGTPNNGQNCRLDKTNMNKTSQHQYLRYFIFTKVFVKVLLFRETESGSGEGATICESLSKIFMSFFH